MGGFEEAEKPEVEKIGESGAEETCESDAGPGLPGDGAPVGERSMARRDGDGKKNESTEDEIPGGHGEWVVLGGDALAENDVHGEAEGAEEGEDITEKRGGVTRDAGTGGEDEDSGESDEHAGALRMVACSRRKRMARMRVLMGPMPTMMEECVTLV